MPDVKPDELTDATVTMTWDEFRSAASTRSIAPITEGRNES